MYFLYQLIGLQEPRKYSLAGQVGDDSIHVMVSPDQFVRRDAIRIFGVYPGPGDEYGYLEVPSQETNVEPGVVTYGYHLDTDPFGSPHLTKTVKHSGGDGSSGDPPKRVVEVSLGGTLLGMPISVSQFAERITGTVGEPSELLDLTIIPRDEEAREMEIDSNGERTAEVNCCEIRGSR